MTARLSPERELAVMRDEAADLARRTRLGHSAECRHLLHDVDPDSTAPAHVVDLTKHCKPRTGGAS